MASLTTARKALLVLVVVNLVDGVISLVDEGVTPSWVVYPILLVIGAVLLLWRPDWDRVPWGECSHLRAGAYPLHCRGSFTRAV